MTGWGQTWFQRVDLNEIGVGIATYSTRCLLIPNVLRANGFIIMARGSIARARHKEKIKRSFLVTKENYDGRNISIKQKRSLQKQ